MKKKNRFRERFTFLVIRDADKSVKQFRISKLLLFAVPTTCIIALVTLLLSIGWLSSYKELLTQQVRELEYVVENKEVDILDKEISIQNLQNEVLELSAQTAEMQTRIEQFAELEKQLQELISTFSDKQNTTSVQTFNFENLAYELLDDSMQAGGEYIPFDEEHAIELAEETKSTLAQMAAELSQLDMNIAEIIKEAEKIKQKLDKTPSFWPTDSTRITSKFGYRKDPITRRTAFHSGVDFGADYGDPVYAAGAGKVVETGYSRTEGNYIVINHGSGLKSKYMHLSKILIKKNQEVYRGDTIGKAGSTGRSTGVHLHFEIFKNGKQVDPLPYITR